MSSLSRKSSLPGFGLTLGYSVVYLSLVVLIPLCGLVLESAHSGWHRFWNIATTPRAVASYKVTFGAAILAAMINSIFGSMVAWVLVRYRFPGRKIVDALIDLPFALPTAVSGIALATLYAQNGWVGKLLAPAGIRVAYTFWGIVAALVFIGLPFMVRTLQPSIESLAGDTEEAALNLGAGPVQVFRRITCPALLPAWITGIGLAFARGVGEYGSVIFIAGNMPMKTEITPLLIVVQLEQFDYPAATAIAIVLLLFSLLMLLVLNSLQTRIAGRGMK